MANTRPFFSTIKAVGGFILPSGGAVKKVLTSDAEGKAAWEAREKVIFVVEHTWAFEGSVAAGIAPGFFVKVGTGNEKKLIAVEYKCESGECEFELRKNPEGGAAEAITGYTALKATSTRAITESTKTLNVKDYVFVKRLSGTPTNLSITAFIEAVVS